MAGKRPAAATIFQLKIELRAMRPPVWRRVLVPGRISLAVLHEVIQVAMGWTDSHLHDFEVDGVRYGVPDPDWGIEVLDESRVTLDRVAAEGRRLHYTYDFGDGWEHVVTVEQVLAAEAGMRYPRCVAGRRACPPEDVGGPWGTRSFSSRSATRRTRSMPTGSSGSAAASIPTRSTGPRSTRSSSNSADVSARPSDLRTPERAGFAARGRR